MKYESQSGRMIVALVVCELGRRFSLCRCIDRNCRCRYNSEPEEACQFQGILVVLLARTGNTLLESIHVSTTQKSNQCGDYSIHMCDLRFLQIIQAGWNLFILRFTAYSLQICDRTAEFLKW